MTKPKFTLSVLEELFGIVKMSPDSDIPKWVKNDIFYSVTVTNEELSFVCLQNSIPEDYVSEDNWRILRINGPLDFSMTGVIAKLSKILSEKKISIFVLSTFDTDYILIKNTNIDKSIAALKGAGYTFIADK